MTPCDGCPFVACRDCRWQGGTDALSKEAENRARHADAADRDPFVVRDNGTAPAGATNTGEGLTAQPLSRAGGDGL